MSICSTHLKSKICLIYVPLTEFWKLNETCNHSPFNLNVFERDEVDAYLWRAGLLNVKEKGMTICYLMNKLLVMFLRGGKVNVVEHWWNIVEKLKLIKWSPPNSSASKTKNINVVPGQLFCHQCKAKFLLEAESLSWWSR